MSKEVLKYLRLVTPGILAYLAFLPLWRQKLSFEHLATIDLQNAVYLIFVIVFGALYRTLHFRDLVFKEPIHEIQANIRDKLLAPFQGEMFARQVAVMEPKRLMKVFYHFIDRDPSLQEKTKDVYENGYLLSTYADFVVISILGAIAYGIGYMFKHESGYIFAVALFVALIGVSLLLIGVAKRAHKRLGDEQLEIIVFHYKGELREKLVQLASEAK